MKASKQHGIWAFVALMGAVFTVVGIIERIVTGHQIVKEGK